MFDWRAESEWDLNSSVSQLSPQDTSLRCLKFSVLLLVTATLGLKLTKKIKYWNGQKRARLECMRTERGKSRPDTHTTIDFVSQAYDFFFSCTNCFVYVLNCRCDLRRHSQMFKVCIHRSVCSKLWNVKTCTACQNYYFASQFLQGYLDSLLSCKTIEWAGSLARRLIRRRGPKRSEIKNKSIKWFVYDTLLR